MITLDSCPICKGKDFIKNLDCKDHSTSKELFTIVSCETCGFIFTNPRPLDKELEKYYISDMYISHTNQKSGAFNWMYQTVRKYAINRKVSLLKKTANKGMHLDIGCGTGEFLNACKEVGFGAKGIEPSDLARNQAINNFNLDVSENIDLSQFNSTSFSSISMWHVLEHVSNIDDTIGQFSRVLRKDGILIVAVPNCTAWDATYYKEFWAAWDVPIHLWHFSKKTIKHLFKNHGFSLVKTKPMIFDSFYVSLLSEEFKTGKKKFINGLVIGLISNIIGLTTKKGCSSTIYVFEKKN